MVLNVIIHRFLMNKLGFLIDYCKNNNLLISGGSDYHGKNKKNTYLGIGKGNMNIPINILDNWEIKF